MADGIWSAASGALAQLRQLDVTANNVANASTLGYRGDTLTFREVLGRTGRTRDRLCKVDGTSSDLTPGALVSTGRPMDVALRGTGYFAVQTDQGERFTRVGNFRLSSDGVVRTADGSTVLGTDRKPLRVPAGTVESDVAFDQNGGLLVKGARAGELLIVSFNDERALQKAGGPLFSSTPAAGDPLPVAAELETGNLEGSNVSAVEGMVDIVGAMRAFEACQRVMDTFRDTGKQGAKTVISPR